MWRKTPWFNFNLPQELWKSTKNRRQFIEYPFWNTNAGNSSQKPKHYLLCRQVLWRCLLLWNIVWLHYINYTSLICFVRLFLNKWDLFIHNVISFIYTPLFMWHLQHANNAGYLTKCWIRRTVALYMLLHLFFLYFRGNFYSDEKRYPHGTSNHIGDFICLNCSHVNVWGGQNVAGYRIAKMGQGSWRMRRLTLWSLTNII